jgi:hypothetical protein
MLIALDAFLFLNFWFFSIHRKMSEEDKVAASAEQPKRTPKLNERILSSLSRRSVAAHPWHDLEIGAWLN